MDAIKLLKEQHAEVKGLFEQYESSDDEGEKQQLCAELSDALAAHATIEEKLFYPAAYVGELKEMLHEAVEEHLAAKRVIADLLEAPSIDESFDAKVKVLQEQIEHHVEEEEGELFPKVRKLMVKEELEALGDAMKQMFDELITQQPRQQVPAETDQAAPLT
jgi:hemerythrin superfamily protein